MVGNDNFRLRMPDSVKNDNPAVFMTILPSKNRHKGQKS